MHRTAKILGALLLLVTSVAQAQGIEPRVPWSPRNASYRIEVTLDAEAKRLEGSLELIWRNRDPEPAQELRFHLYWNAWRNNRSTWMLERRLRDDLDAQQPIADDDWGWQEVESLEVLRQEFEEYVDLTSAMQFLAPDDGNVEDRTVMAVPLPYPLEFGEEIRVRMKFSAKIPRTFDRTGFRGDYYFIAHWFPKLGVFRDGEWNCHQFHASTEFFADFGSYDVSITLPTEFVLGASGRELAIRDNEDGTSTHQYHEDDIHGFAWTASPDYEVRTEMFEHSRLPSVEMRLLIQPEHLDQTERHFEAVRAALESYGTWYGAYPYGHVTVVDPAYGSGAGGMEYPTLFTCGTRLFNPPGVDRPESVTVHETGHQFWYGMVGNNEFEHAWLDEGLNTFSTLRTLDQHYGPKVLGRRYLSPPGRNQSGRGFFVLRFPGIDDDRWITRVNRYRRSATVDRPDEFTFQYYPASAGNISYSKVALWLATLERHLGWETLRSILSTFFERYQFGHPAPEDFFSVASEISGQDLGWFFDQVHRSSVSFDYKVKEARSEPMKREGLEDGPSGPTFIVPGDPDRETFRTEVVVQRIGGGYFPMEVLLVFEDGHETRHRWDGKSRWKLFVEERQSRLSHAVIDPDRILMLDLSYSNNSRLVESSASLPATKWSAKWMIWLQDLMSTFAFFI